MFNLIAGVILASLLLLDGRTNEYLRREEAKADALIGMCGAFSSIRVTRRTD